MKILFLDIDGVLNPMYPNNPQHYIIPDYGEREEYWRQWKKAKKYIYNKMKPFREANCKIVISSSWRGDIENIPLYFALKGFMYPDDVIGRTGHKKGTIIYKGEPMEIGSCRGLEIQEWLEVKGSEYGVKSFAILDDEGFDIDTFYQDEFVKVGGLTESDADKVIEILNKED